MNDIKKLNNSEVLFTLNHKKLYNNIDSNLSDNLLSFKDNNIFNLFNLLDTNICNKNSNIINQSKIEADINDGYINKIIREDLFDNRKYKTIFSIYDCNKYELQVIRFCDNKKFYFDAKLFIEDKEIKNLSTIINYIINAKWRIKLLFNKYLDDTLLSLINIIDNNFIYLKYNKRLNKFILNNIKIKFNKSNIKNIEINKGYNYSNLNIISSIYYKILFKPSKVFNESELIIKRNIYHHYQELFIDSIIIKSNNNYLFEINNRDKYNKILKEVFIDMEQLIWK